MPESGFGMERLDFQLPDFTRLSWTSDEARREWEPRLQGFSRAWADIEWRSIKAGVRRCALTVVPAQDLVARSAKWASHELSGLPLETQGMGNFGYSSTTVQPSLGMPFGYRVVIGTPADVAEFKAAYDSSDNLRIGQLLGFPDCCLQFFEDTWVNASMVDTTWPMAVRTVAPGNSETVLQVSGPPEANILWRWMSVRAVPHLPCSFDCKASVEFGRKLMAVGRDIGFSKEIDDALEILSWPVEWNALHGIAEIRTPILKASVRTDATAKKYVVQRPGDTYPADGAQALTFPYNTPKRPLLTATSHFKRGLENPISVTQPLPSWYASDNGFRTEVAMRSAHKPIIDLAVSTLGKAGGNVLDLGCGNGALLQAIRDKLPTAIPYGIECDPERLAHAGTLMPDIADHFVVGDMFDDGHKWIGNQQYSLAILMPGRLIEIPVERRQPLINRLTDQCQHVLVYAYGDWLTRFDDLVGLADAAGLTLIDGTPKSAKVGLLAINRS